MLTSILFKMKSDTDKERESDRDRERESDRDRERATETERDDVEVRAKREIKRKILVERESRRKREKK